MKTIVDDSIYEYRASKDTLNAPAIAKALAGTFQKGSVDTTCGPVEFMVYRPKEAAEDQVLPVVFSFHGGGFVLGYYEADGPYCQNLADQSQCMVINVDYPLAPENKFPKPVFATYEALEKIAALHAKYRFDPNQVIVMGHSAGGCLAVDMCLLNREHQKLAIKGQILDYAPLHQSLSPEDRKALDPSKAISANRMVQYINWYFADLDDLQDPLASPALADLSDLPDALVIAAEYDSLRNEEEAFAKRANAQGTQAIFTLYPDACHGFTHEHLKEFNPSQAKAAWKQMADFIRSHVHEPVFNSSLLY